jgi:hypothetical protein
MACEEPIAPNTAMPTAMKSRQKKFRNRVGLNARLSFLVMNVSVTVG